MRVGGVDIAQRIYDELAEVLVPDPVSGLPPVYLMEVEFKLRIRSTTPNPAHVEAKRLLREGQAKPQGVVTRTMDEKVWFCRR